MFLHQEPGVGHVATPGFCLHIHDAPIDLLIIIGTVNDRVGNDSRYQSHISSVENRVNYWRVCHSATSAGPPGGGLNLVDQERLEIIPAVRELSLTLLVDRLKQLPEPLALSLGDGMRCELPPARAHDRVPEPGFLILP